MAVLPKQDSEGVVDSGGTLSTRIGTDFLQGIRTLNCLHFFSLNGSLTRDFSFFHKSVSPGLSHRGYLELLRKFAEIFATLCLSPVLLTPAINDRQFCCYQR